MPYTPIMATLGYVLSPDRERVLLVHRTARQGDQHYGRYNGLGGKLEPGEDVVAGMRRELREEASIEVDTLTLRATINWPGFGKQGEDWFSFVFLITAFSGTPPSSNPEGALEWVPVSRLLALELPLWPGDHFFLPLVFGPNPGVIHGVMPYENGQPTSWSYTVI